MMFHVFDLPSDSIVYLTGLLRMMRLINCFYQSPFHILCFLLSIDVLFPLKRMIVSTMPK